MVFSWCSPFTVFVFTTKIIPLVRADPETSALSPSSVYGSRSTAGRRRSCPQPSLPSLTAAGAAEITAPQRKIVGLIHFDIVSPCYDTDPQVLRLCGQFPLSPLDPPRSAGGEPLGLTLNVGAEGRGFPLQPHFDEGPRTI